MDDNSQPSDSKVASSKKKSSRGASLLTAKTASSNVTNDSGASHDGDAKLSSDVTSDFALVYAMNDDEKSSGPQAAVAMRTTTTISQHDRLVGWFADVLHQYLQKIVAKRIASTITDRHQQPPRHIITEDKKKEALMEVASIVHVVNEVTEVISMPDFDEQTAMEKMDPALVELGSTVREQLGCFVANVAASYRDNAFHNFEHASHVAMSAKRLLDAMLDGPAAGDDDVTNEGQKPPKRLKSSITEAQNKKDTHEATFGISSDPQMQFAILFSALIHDLDHRGLTNQQLIQNNDPLALKYIGRSVAEQHSISCAWEILTADQFTDLRNCIYQTEEERLRFRQLVITAVIATDMADGELQARRKIRWIEACPERESTIQSQAMIGRRAILICELIIQSSDISHIMQHWQIYQTWNKRLFDERYAAHVEGKVDEDPSLGWYQGELLFVDNYVIPLARCLQQCKLFGDLSSEFLNYALANRQQWEVKGDSIVREMVASFREKLGGASEQPTNTITK